VKLSIVLASEERASDAEPSPAHHTGKRRSSEAAVRVPWDARARRRLGKRGRLAVAWA